MTLENPFEVFEKKFPLGSVVEGEVVNKNEYSLFVKVGNLEIDALKLLKKKIGMFCTGGIRCEKASNFLINMGYKNIFQLDGGIIEYLNKTKNKR